MDAQSRCMRCTLAEKRLAHLCGFSADIIWILVSGLLGVRKLRVRRAVALFALFLYVIFKTDTPFQPILSVKCQLTHAM
jgi:hypothetical protein